MKKFRVPNYDVNVEPYELLVINTPTFQRLFRLQQLGLAYTVYPFATYTRAAHAIETLNYAQRIIDSLKDRYPIGDDDIKRIRMAALLHDIAHLPYSHTLEDENIVFPQKHDKKDRLEKFLTNLKKEIVTPDRNKLSLLEPNKQTWELALKLVDQAKLVLLTISYGEKKQTEGVELLSPEDWYIADIVGNTISADLLAYIKRDVEYTGIEKRHGGYRIFDYLKIAKDKDGRNRLAIGLIKAGFRIDVFSAILDVLDIRYALMERVVFHHGKCAASAMLARAARLLNLQETEDLYTIGDELFLHSLLETARKVEKKEGKELRETKDAACRLIERLCSRIFYKRVYKVTRGERIEYNKSHQFDLCSRFRDPAKSAEFENDIEDQFKLPRGSIAIFCPDEKMNLKEAKVMVDLGKTYVYPLNDDKFKDEYPKFWERVDQIESRYEELWYYYVFIEPDQFGKAALIQQYLYEKMEVKNDPLLDLYLQDKPEYQRSREFVRIAAKRSNEVKSNALDGLLQQAAWDGRPESWEHASRTALDGAMMLQLERAPYKKEEGRESKEVEDKLPLFGQKKEKNGADQG